MVNRLGGIRPGEETSPLPEGNDQGEGGEREESRLDDDHDRVSEKGREQSRKGGQRERGAKGKEKRGRKQTLTSESGKPGEEAFWGD